MKETTDIIRDVLLGKGYLQPPETFKIWENVARGFENRWKFPAGAKKHMLLYTDTCKEWIFIFQLQKELKNSFACTFQLF